MKISTENDGYCWLAVDEDTYDGAPDGGGVVGTGGTELDAIKDLLNKLENKPC